MPPANPHGMLVFCPPGSRSHPGTSNQRGQLVKKRLRQSSLVSHLIAALLVIVAGPVRSQSVIPEPRVNTEVDGFTALKEDTPHRAVASAELLAGVVRAWPIVFDDRVRASWSVLRARPEGGDLAGQQIRVTWNGSIPFEGYRLTTDVEQGVMIEASSDAGVFYALQTLDQLLRPGNRSGGQPGYEVAATSIEDAPRFSYRGFHLDVARHFFDVDFVKKQIDTMARLKFNRFHWHLTEDQGWRVPIDAFPKLTEVGAWRDQTQVGKQRGVYDGKRHGGFYTKDEIRDVVAYAADRHVTVIPEIEMPGHATAAIAAYPELGCGDEPVAVSGRWGIHETVFCPSEETFAFLFAVLDEVLELFPSEYIHIGADEVRKVQWQKSELAQQVMRREGLANEDELQSWFVRRIERYLNGKGRRLIGWDEILEGGLAPNATVMTWRTEESAVEAASMGHDVIRTPIQHAYFDFSQAAAETEPLANNWAGFPLPLERVYSFEPVPKDLAAEHRHHILGGQLNLWTELISTEEHAEYMLYPRALALAEVLWTQPEQRDFDDFVSRLGGALERLRERGVNFRWPKEQLGPSPATP